MFQTKDFVEGGWAATPLKERSGMLMRVKQLVDEHSEMLAEIMTLESVIVIRCYFHLNDEAISWQLIRSSLSSVEFCKLSFSKCFHLNF